MSARVAPSTIAHVLRLVGSSYLDSGAGPSRAYRRLPLALSAVTTSVRTSRRFASSAHALTEAKEHTHHEHHRELREHHERHHEHAGGLPVVLTPKRRRPEPRPRPPIPQWAQLRKGMARQLFGPGSSDATTFRSRYQQAEGSPLMLLPAERLGAVAELWCSPRTSNADWAWLLLVLNEAKEANPNWDELPGSESLFRVLRGVALAVSGDYETARANVAVGLKAALNSVHSTDAFPARDLLVLEEYAALCRKAGRIEDVAVAIKYAGQKLHKRLCQISGTHMGGEEAQRLRRLMHEALNDLPNPVAWLEQQYNIRGRDGGVSRANYHLAVTLLSALVADKSRASDAFVFWRTVTQRFNSTSIPPVVTSLLAANLAEDGNLAAARQVFESLHEKLAAVPHSALSRELWVFASKGMLDEALNVWNILVARYAPTRRDRLAYATTYAARGDHDGTHDALVAMFGEEILKDVEGLVILQRACIMASDAEGALKYLNLATAIEPTLGPFQALLFLYAKQANVDGAVSVFQRMVAAGLQPTREAYTSLISVFANQADYVNAGYIFDAMKKAGHEPDAITWSALLNASIEAGEWIHAAELCEQIPHHLMRSNALSTTILKAYVLVRAPSDVIMKLFRRMSAPGERAWALAIQAAADDNNQVLARSLFDEMDSRSKIDALAPAPTVYVFSILLAMYLRAGDRESSRAVYDTMIYRNILPTSVTYGIITTSYANSPGESSVMQAHNFAMEVYDMTLASELPHARGESSENVFGPLLIAAGRAQDMERVKQYYDLIRSTGCNSLTLTTKLMDAYRRSGQIKPMYRLWLRIFKDAVRTVPRLDPTKDTDPYHITTRSQNNLLCVPLSITIKAFAEAGLHDRLKRLWLSVRASGFGFDSQNYNHMAAALAMTGDVEGAFHIVDRVLIPRYEEVRNRYFQAMRDNLTLLPVDVDSTPEQIPDPELDAWGDWKDPDPVADPVAAAAAAAEGTTAMETSDEELYVTADDVAERGPRVSNRRHDFLPTAAPRGRESDESEADAEYEPDLDILRFWRPSDILWRPSAETVRILAQTYTQLEDQRAYQAWVGLSAGDEPEDDADAEPREPPVLTLPEFNNVTVKDEHGQPKRMSPRTLLFRLNRKYVRAVALVSFHRRKRAAQQHQQQFGR